jgi:hypothetical protein
MIKNRRNVPSKLQQAIAEQEYAMNGRILQNANGQPMMSQQQAQNIQMQQIYTNYYLELTKIAFAEELRKVSEFDDTGINTERLCNNAKKAAVAVMKTIGINVQDVSEPPAENK